MKAPRYHHACAVFQGQVWVAGGFRDDYGSDHDVVEIYDPDTNTWTEGPRRPQSTYDYKPQLVEVYGQLYYIGGHKIGKIYRLNRNKDDWEEVRDIQKGYKYVGLVMNKIC